MPIMADHDAAYALVSSSLKLGPRYPTKQMAYHHKYQTSSTKIDSLAWKGELQRRILNKNWTGDLPTNKHKMSVCFYYKFVFEKDVLWPHSGVQSFCHDVLLEIGLDFREAYGAV